MSPILILLTALTSTLLGAKENESDKGLYDPAMSQGQVATHLTSFNYNNRKVPLKIYLPTSKANRDGTSTGKAAPLILLSHGLGGSREAGTYLGQHWAGRGFAVVAMQHLGSDDSVWKNAPMAKRMQALKAAANKSTFLDRMHDVPATLDQLEKWAADKKHVLHGKLDFKKVGISGHSYGATTTQALCGQLFPPIGGTTARPKSWVMSPQFADPRIDAGLPLSPSAPQWGSAKKAFGQIKIPMLMMTGSNDRSPINRTTAESRREVYRAMPSRSKYELVLEGAQHMAFSDRARLGKSHRNPKHHRAIKALSSAFWETYLMDSPAARQWLDGKSPYQLLDDADIWQKK